MPHEYEDLGPGEQLIVKALLEFEIEEHNEEVKEK